MLAHSFESNCVEYNIRNKQGIIRMENDCRLNCIAKVMNENFKTVTTIMDLNYLIRKEACSFFGNISINLNKDNYMKNFSDICAARCKPDCNMKQYFTEITKLAHIYPDPPIHDTRNITFRHSSTPDVIVRHILEMSLMSFVCNFGGLLGMWLGFSVLSISKDTFQSILHIFNRNKIIVNNNIQLNVNNNLQIRKSYNNRFQFKVN